MKILITICARGGSKGIPGKNIQPLNGIPLIDYTIRVANKFKSRTDAKIALSTDDLHIKEIAKKSGLSTDYYRPGYLATDAAGKIATINDLLLYEESLINTKYDYVLDLDVTSPLRNCDDLEKSLKLIENSTAITLFSVNQSVRNPYFNMVEENMNGFYSLVKQNPDGTSLTRQSAPPVYDLNASFYWYKREFFDSSINSPITDKSIVYVMPHICFDLDHPIDFTFMEYLLTNNKLDFEL